MVEVNLEKGVSEGLLIGYSVVTTLVVAIHLLALMISTCILPNIEAVSNVHNVTAVSESPHDKMRWYVEMAWICSTGVGILLFLVQMVMLVWVRFHGFSSYAPAVSTVLLVPVILIFIGFGVHFYRQLIAHKYERSTKGLEELQSMANQLENTQVVQTV